MQIYTITSAEGLADLKNWLTFTFGTVRVEIWINAMLINGQWVTSDGKPLFSGAIPTTNLGQGFCIVFSNVNGYFEIIVKDCATLIGSISEFFNNTKVGFTMAPTSKSNLKLDSNSTIYFHSSNN